MKKALLLALAPLLIAAGPTHNFAPNHRSAVVMTNVPLDGSGASLSFSVQTRGYGILAVTLNHSANTSSTDVGMTCTESPDGGVTNGVIQECQNASGNCTSNDARWTKAISGVKVWPWRVNVLGFRDVTCTLTSTGAAATDLISVQYHLSTK